MAIPANPDLRALALALAPGHPLVTVLIQYSSCDRTSTPLPAKASNGRWTSGHPAASVLADREQLL